MARILNDQFLEELGSTWYDPTFCLQSGMTASDIKSDRFRSGISSFLDAHAEMTPLIVKDPRITALAPFWLDVAQRSGWIVKIIIAARHPDEVRASFMARDALSVELADTLWLKYSLLAERLSRGFPRVFIRYELLLADWQKEMVRINDHLDVHLTTKKVAAVTSFLNPALRHHFASEKLPIGNPWLAAVDHEISAACADRALNCARMDDLYNLFVSADCMLRQARNDFDEAKPPIGIPKPVDYQLPLPSLVYQLITDFSEPGYLSANPDVKAAVENGIFTSALEHWLQYGRAEGRSLR